LQQNSNKKSPKNRYSKNILLKDELKRQKQQTQYFNKINKDDYSDLLNYRDGTPASNTLAKQASLSASKYQKNRENDNPILTMNTNSRFKPINKTNVKNTSQPATPVAASVSLVKLAVTGSNTPGILNINRKQNQQAYAKENFIRAKRQLDFCGPESWLNFKLDHHLLIMDLPLPL
jgi:hypothetical protein